MRVLLVYPPVLDEETYGRHAFGAPMMPPLSLGYIASSIRHDHEVKVVDGVADKITMQDLGRIIKQYSPDVVGVTSTTITYLKAKRLFSLVKSIDPSIRTVYGGVHLSATGTQTMKECPDLDIGVMGEGEVTAPRLMGALESGKDLSGVKGLLYRKGKGIKATAPSEKISNIDSVAWPSRDLFGDLSRYSQTPTRGRGLTVSVITSRGCPYNCSYCDQWMFGRRWRAHSARYVIEELRHLKERYNAEHISIEDDTFTVNKKRTIKICKGIIDEGLDITFNLSTRVETLDDEVLTWLKKAGCHIIYLGVESGDSEMLKFINRTADKEKIARVSKNIVDHGIKVYGSFIVGLPKETRETAKSSLDFALSLPLDAVSFNVFTPYPMTELARVAPKHGTVRTEWEYYSDHAPRLPFIPEGWTEEGLLKFQADAYKKFYMRPSYILNNLNKLTDGRFIMKALQGLKVFFTGDGVTVPMQPSDEN